MSQTPTINRMVTFRDPEINQGKPTAAIVTGVNDDGTISLHYFAPKDHGMAQDVPIEEVARKGSGHRRYWSWPDINRPNPGFIETNGGSSGPQVAMQKGAEFTGLDDDGSDKAKEDKHQAALKNMASEHNDKIERNKADTAKDAHAHQRSTKAGGKD